MLGRTTAEELGVLKVGQKAMRAEVNTITDNTQGYLKASGS